MRAPPRPLFSPGPGLSRYGTRSGAAREGAMKYVLISAGLIGLYFALARTGNATAAAVLTIGAGVIATVILGLMKDA
jgi:hypothetical protein